MPFSPARVVSILVSEFGPPEDSSAATREERKIAARFAAILREGAATFVEIETDEDLDAGDSTDNDSDWDCSDGEDGCTTSANEVYFGTSAISPDQVCL
ncbi:unnamed protein product [Heligmosomoides polygyrus]|uniref:Uncharacterized protein n=1 Tax=Heligmosomoides polygyrus TaxID=6339 RepID=A0A183FPH6_HELPZ|nr:unnamed protein product [Heligmosomoides polygyrus]